MDASRSRAGQLCGRQNFLSALAGADQQCSPLLLNAATACPEQHGQHARRLLLVHRRQRTAPEVLAGHLGHRTSMAVLRLLRSASPAGAAHAPHCTPKRLRSHADWPGSVTLARILVHGLSASTRDVRRAPQPSGCFWVQGGGECLGSHPSHMPPLLLPGTGRPPAEPGRCSPKKAHGPGLSLIPTGVTPGGYVIR